MQDTQALVDSQLDRLRAAIYALPPLTDEECRAIGDLMVQIRVHAARQAH